MATVNLINVCKHYGKESILKHIDLNIEKGEFVAVVGPSGSGKSTLLRVVAGLDTISNGQILINNKCVNKIKPAERDIAMVFQHYALYPHMTVQENIAYGLKMRKMPKAQIQTRVKEVAALLQLDDYLSRTPGSLSGGQRQRVAIGRAMARSPAIFLFDEPLSNLDAKLRTEMRHEIKKLHQQLNTTCLYVTHDQSEAMSLADKVVVLHEGSIEQIDSPQQLYQTPASMFVASFIGYYPMNFFPARIDYSQKQLMTEIGICLPLPAFTTAVSDRQEIMIGIRPEHCQLANPSSAQILSGRIEFIDDMGSDKIVQLMTVHGGQRLVVRLPSETYFKDNTISLEIKSEKANIYCPQSGRRIGGWDAR